MENKVNEFLNSEHITPILANDLFKEIATELKEILRSTFVLGYQAKQSDISLIEKLESDQVYYESLQNRTDKVLEFIIALKRVVIEVHITEQDNIQKNNLMDDLKNSEIF